MKCVRLVLDSERLDGTRFHTENWVRRLLPCVDIHDAMHPLQKCSHAAVPHMGAIVVVAEENRSTDEVPGTERHIVRAQDFDSVCVAFRPVLCAGAITVL